MADKTLFEAGISLTMYTQVDSGRRGHPSAFFGGNVNTYPFGKMEIMIKNNPPILSI